MPNQLSQTSQGLMFFFFFFKSQGTLTQCFSPKERGAAGGRSRAPSLVLAAGLSDPSHCVAGRGSYGTAPGIFNVGPFLIYLASFYWGGFGSSNCFFFILFCFLFFWTVTFQQLYDRTSIHVGSKLKTLNTLKDMYPPLLIPVESPLGINTRVWTW